jgi:hypothetical protein
VEADTGNTSTGTVQSAGAFSGVYPKTYTITIATGGDVGAATFNWTDTLGGSGSGLTTGTDVALDEGVTVTFTDGTSPSFVSTEKWYVYVRTDINVPTLPALAARIEDGKIMCSTCHQQHSQVAEPFDPNAPAYGGSGTGDGRHFQRLSNNLNQMCLDCHSARDVALSSDGSHPVGVSIPGTGDFQSPVARTITGAADNGSGLIRITATAHGFATNDTVTISGVVGTIEANGTWAITKIDADTFDLNGS